MNTAVPLHSWHLGRDAMDLSQIIEPEFNLAAWTREPNPVIEAYLNRVFEHVGINLRTVYSLDTLSEELLAGLPEGEGKSAFVEDVHLLAEMLCCLFDCNSFGLRLTPMTQAMCPKFHVDNIQVRLVCTYIGKGTQWLPNSVVNREKLGKGSAGMEDHLSGLYPDNLIIPQLESFDVALLKGEAWHDEGGKGLVHRSCPMAEGEQRMLLTLDPM